MKQERFAGLVLSIANIILIVFCLFFYIRMDRTVPVIEFQSNNLVYVSGTTNETKLFEGITAYDSNDGDITDRIVIEKMIEDEEESTIVVFYAVCDKAGNVAKASREFEARFLKKDKEEVLNEIKEAGIDADLVVEIQEDESETSEEDGEAASDEEETIEPQAEAENVDEPEQAPEAQPVQPPAEPQPEQAPAEPQPEQAPAPQPEQAPAPQPEQAPAPQPEQQAPAQ